jgi:hypothetical protein
MPQVSTIGLINNVQPILGSYAFGPSDTYATVTADTVFPAFAVNGAGGLILSLPGPDLAPVIFNSNGQTPGTANDSPGNNLPSNGDFYKFNDPRGVLSTAGGTKTVTIWGGGYPMWNGNTGIGDAVLVNYIQIDLPFGGFEFTFDDVNQAWIVCACGPTNSGE